METYQDFLAHHGILGMKWGQRNGPPYPLGSSQMSRAEQRRNNKKNYKILTNKKDLQGSRDFVKKGLTQSDEFLSSLNKLTDISNKIIGDDFYEREPVYKCIAYRDKYGDGNDTEINKVFDGDDDGYIMLGDWDQGFNNSRNVAAILKYSNEELESLRQKYDLAKNEVDEKVNSFIRDSLGDYAYSPSKLHPSKYFTAKDLVEAYVDGQKSDSIYSALVALDYSPSYADKLRTDVKNGRYDDIFKKEKEAIDEYNKGLEMTKRLQATYRN